MDFRSPSAVATLRAQPRSASLRPLVRLPALALLSSALFAQCTPAPRFPSVLPPPLPAPERGSAGAGGASSKGISNVPLQAPPADFDVAARGEQVLAHLSAVIRYFRSTQTPIQKVGEPSDALYRDQAVTDARQIGDYAFQSGKAEASLLVAYQKQQAAAQGHEAVAEGEAQKLQTARATVAKRIADLEAQQKLIAEQLGHARPKQIPVLLNQREQVEGALELNTAMSDALGKIVGMSDTQGRAGLAGDIERLQRTAPELADTKSKVVAAPLESLSSEKSAGVTSQATVLFELLTTRHLIDQSIEETDALHQEALELRTPLTNIVRSMVRKGQDLAQQQQTAATASATAALTAAAPTAITEAAQLKETRDDFNSVTATFKVLSAAAVPLSQEIITLEQSRANLLGWRTAVDTEYDSVLRSLLLRILVILIALGVLSVVGEIWRRATTRYVRDLRRRRQLLILRRLVIGFLSGLVVIFGFVTQFNSLATFAGFITAGLAVGLQTILLSVAAYFFIIGRYGVRVGDRITVASVTGDVIEVGLVRFYVMELAGSGTELQQTGRVAVFSNAILFQAGTPLYKQMPGTEYAWHELSVKLQQTAEYAAAGKSVVGAVQGVYATYQARIEQQHKNLESWVDTHLDAPGVTSRMQLVDGGLELLVRYPVEIREASSADQQVTAALLHLMQEDAAVRGAVTAPPQIKAAVKG